MSFDALAWAAKRKPGNLAAKMVLLALANYADEHGCAYPSTAALADFGDMDHKTATAALDRLTKLGLIEDSGCRAGRTKQIKVYRLLMESPPKTEASQNRKASVFSDKAPQKRGTDTVMEPEGIEASASTPSAWARPVGVDAQVWKDLLSNRKRKHKTNSPTAWKRFCDDLRRISASSGIPPNQLIEHAAAEGWAGIYEPNARDNRNGQSRSQSPGIGATERAMRTALASIEGRAVGARYPG